MNGKPALYIYYRVAESDLAAITAAVRRMQQELSTTLPGLDAGIARRPEVTEGLVTLMEIYHHPDLATDPKIAPRIERHAQALAPWRRSPRKAERFDPL